MTIFCVQEHSIFKTEAADREKKREHQAYEHLSHWEPVKRILPPESMLDPQDGWFGLFNWLYVKTRKLYYKVPVRRNGEDPFIHPLNTVLFLKKAKISDGITLCAGLIHDFVEEKVDLFKAAQNIADSSGGKLQLDRYEQEVFQELQQDTGQFFAKEGLPAEKADELLETVRLLTRHKRDFYYRSIAEIFNCRNPELKERAVQIKLADRMHNVQSIESFNQEERIYACFKTLFILNNAKKFLMDTYGEDYLLGRKYTPTEKLFNKCARAGYDAFLTICQLSRRKGIFSVVSLLQLAFRKFTLEKEGLWVVTAVDNAEVHPLRLYQGIVRKYDARLHHEWEQFRQMEQDEIEYCLTFFSDHAFSKEQLKEIVWYKDAFALKEVIAYMMYLPEYYVQRFICAELTGEGRIKK